MVLSFYYPILGSRNKDVETFYNRDIIVEGLGMLAATQLGRLRRHPLSRRRGGTYPWSPFPGHK